MPLVLVVMGPPGTGGGTERSACQAVPDAATDTGGVQTQVWWRDKRQGDGALLIAFAALALTGILFVAFTNYLFAGDQRVVRVTMEQNAGQPAREALKQACGDLPGVTPVPDRGDPDPRIQGRF